MSVIKQKAVQCIHNFLRARNVPESQWPERVKKDRQGNDTGWRGRRGSRRSG